MTYFETVMAGLTAIYVLATIFYAVTSQRTLSTMEGQAKTSGEQFTEQMASFKDRTERQLRAYVLVDSGNIFNVADPVPLFLGQIFEHSEAQITNQAAGPGVRIFIKNTGQTPAYDVRHWGNICFREFPLKAPLPARDPKFPPVPLILGREIMATKLLFIPQPLSAKEIADLRAGTGAVYVYGEITYQDTFGKNWYTHYRLMYHPYGGAIGVSTDLSFVESGNEAT